MEDYTNYMLGWVIYGVVGTLLYVLLWLGIRWMPGRNMRFFLRATLLAILVVPWRGEDPEVYFAPVIIVGAFAFMDTGPSAALLELQPLLAVILVIAVVTLVKEILEFGWRWRRRSADDGTDEKNKDEVKE
ncbi:hypothetical protein E4656_03790 [Natronospirillum operosum]|uniref:Uncharacterized protein n=1 Tax=Natronospirillum operosum TaxID=2759953 RepID=A0A4Z0WA87_9GAMM|nr:hypothetical protein [Natronospirillum operosum]TGG95549.1 hypothetical protein E4656_03790 [Natronospirillum operosum]